METDKPRISTVARLGVRVVALEQGMLEVAIGLAQELELATSELEIALAAALALGAVDRLSPEATDQLAVEHKISGPLIGRVAQPVQEISLAATALALAQVRAARVAAPARCRLSARPVSLAEIVSEIVVSHPVQDSVRVATLLVAVGLGATPLDRPVVAEVPAWAVAVLVVVEEAAVAEDAEEEAADAEGKQIIR
jgi:hypothetical protein